MGQQTSASILADITALMVNKQIKIIDKLTIRRFRQFPTSLAVETCHPYSISYRHTGVVRRGQVASD